MLIQLIAQNKEQQDQITAMNLVMGGFLVQQTTIVHNLRATELLWQIESKGKDSPPTSNEDSTKEMVKLFGPR